MQATTSSAKTPTTPTLHGTSAPFPRLRLADELRVRGLAPSTAAARAGLRPCVVLPWVKGENQPRADGLRRLLEANEIDLAAYAAYLTAVGPIMLVCPSCGAERPLPRGQLAAAGRRARGRAVLPRRADGSYERPCRKCSSQRNQPKAQKRANEQRQASAQAMRCRPIEVDIRREQLQTNWERFRQQARRPKDAQHRQAIGEGHRLRGDFKRPFDLCALCNLLLHPLVSHKQGTAWHRRCALQWIYWRRSHRDAPKAPPRGRSRPGHRNLTRNLRWLLWRQKDMRTCAELLAIDQRDLAPYRGRTRAHRPSRSTVTEGVHSLVRYLPGSWEFVFPIGSGKPGALVTTGTWIGQRARQRRDQARTYQRLFPLPDKLRPLVDVGKRDPLIARLHGFGMPEDWIVRLTGAPRERVLEVISRTRSQS